MTIDELLEPDHPARAVWSYVEGLDLTPLYDRIRARGSVAGRPAIDPRLLVALWLYATLSGFGSARELADLCLRHDAFRHHRNRRRRRCIMPRDAWNASSRP